MSERPRISSRIKSGEKFRTSNGVVAIKDGIKSARPLTPELQPPGLQPPALQPRAPKPPWLRVKAPGGAGYTRVKDIVRSHKLATVCEESHCPNIGECWSNGTATLMVMGSVCTRACRFCAVDTGNPNGWLDPDEPDHAADAVRLMSLGYVVITSVDRDDLPDGGAAHYSACVRAIRRMNPNTHVEALTPDFRGDLRAVATVATSGLHVFSQNIETVQRLTHEVRDPRAGYQQTLGVLRHSKQVAPAVLTKTSILLGLGERDDEILRTMDDLRAHDVDILALGQYLRPTQNHLPLQRWVTPAEFEQYRQWGLDRGFLEVASGPLVRSSYRAERVFEGNNLGLPLIPVTTL